MKKLLSSILSLSLYCSAFAAPYLIMDFHFSNKNIMGNTHAIDLIVTGKSVPFDVYRKSGDEKTAFNDGESPIDVKSAYQTWFKNLKDRIEEENRTEFDFMLDVINFGVSDKVAVERDHEKSLLNDSLQVLTVSKDDPSWANRGNSSGFFLKNGTHMEIQLLEDDYTKPQAILLHEVGHSLGIADSYPGGAHKEDLIYGSEIRPSVMNRENSLTCDDADALASSIYLTMKDKNLYLNDFEFESFCKQDDGSRIKIRNAKQLSRKPSLLALNGKYYITEFCEETGEIKSSIEINPRETQPITKTEYKKCKAIPFEYKKPEIKTDESKTNIFVDLSEGKHPKITPDAKTVVYESATGIVREITFNNEVSKTMVRVKNDKGQLLYVFAILDGERAFAFSPNDSLMLLYHLKDYKKYTLSIGNSAVHTENNPDAVDLLPKLRAFINKDRLYITDGIFNDNAAAQKPASYITQAVKWQNYLQENYPHKELKVNKIKISQKDVEEFGKSLKFSLK